MIIETNKGTFGNFRDVLTDMQVENYDHIFLKSVDWWGTQLIVGGGALYSKSDIEHIINDEF